MQIVSADCFFKTVIFTNFWNSRN